MDPHRADPGFGMSRRALVTKKGSAHYNKPWTASRLETRVFEAHGTTVKYYKPGASAPEGSPPPGWAWRP